MKLEFDRELKLQGDNTLYRPLSNRHFIVLKTIFLPKYLGYAFHSFKLGHYIV